MRRVLVIGSSGSGKSTFAQTLGERAGLPVVHLDRLYWRPGWVPAPEPEFDAAVEAEIARDAWVLDGNYSRTLAFRVAAADTIVFLDRTRASCFARVIRRRFSYVGRTRVSMTPGCPERISWELLGFIWRYPKKRPGRFALLAAFATKGGQSVVLRSDEEARAFLAGLPKSGGV